jgi:hypothetical protein
MPWNPAKLLLASTVLALLGGCASSMSKDECRMVDWRTVGYEDGVAGRPGNRIGDHRRACAEHGVAPDLTAYMAGREAGMREFCQASNGYRVGASGQAYAGTCPADLAPAFERGYDVGRELHVRQRRVDDTESAIAYRRREIRRLEDLVAREAFVLIGDGATTEERAQSVIDAKQAAERIGRYRSEIDSLERELVQHRHDLDAYQRTVPATY